MAKRRKVTAPSADELSKIEAEFRRETLNRPNAGVAPISQVAAESARAHTAMDAENRAEIARDKTEAAAHREAKGQGRIIEEIPLDRIAENAMVRDRMILDAEEMDELKLSIGAHGLRLPIEVYPQDDAEKPYGLISGYRRLQAVRDLYALTKQEKYATIKALVREPEALGGAITAMVEENEIRASLSHFERGRIAVISAQQGVFASAEAAVNALFSSASKAKRSKIRSFALIFEELGDMLLFPEMLKEKDGLRVAAVLRAGAESRIRENLAQGQDRDECKTPEEEWILLEEVVKQFEKEALPSPKGGRPKRKSGWDDSHTLELSTGITLQRGSDTQGHLIRIKGGRVDSVMVDEAMQYLARLFEKD
ncbi:ParB/RepB/Spo0J family partition protein (plasmid) [Falsihalocynthiibacter sp. SS001]|uniref:ParB/RepB/Spo0J family partition protein n=1 Tax=Falsihalocynthiibacter sp. SS001 TaxID=3349698 RepID=UPI0036D3FB96